jgi:integrase
MHQDGGKPAGGAAAGDRARHDRTPASKSTQPAPVPRRVGRLLGVHNFRALEWKPAQRAAGIEPLRRIYDLRHTFATFALRSGISTFDLSRDMGASLTMIDRHDGHLARDGREHAIRLLDELGAGLRPRWPLVDAAWTPDAAAAATVDNETIS